MITKATDTTLSVTKDFLPTLDTESGNFSQPASSSVRPCSHGPWITCSRTADNRSSAHVAGLTPTALWPFSPLSAMPSG